jgi:hypothetical protein
VAAPCSVCGELNAPFGYFPPLVEAEEWRCGAHRLEGSVELKPVRTAPAVRADACIVCDGEKVIEDEPCWCCELRLTGPRRVTVFHCYHCEGADDEPGNRLLRLIQINASDSVYVHARCWTACREEQLRGRRDRPSDSDEDSGPDEPQPGHE